MQGSLGHCPELVEVKFFFLVQLAEMSKKELLTRRYRTAKAVRFDSPRGRLVVRVRVLDDRERAQQLAAETKTPEGAVFLLRLD